MKKRKAGMYTYLCVFMCVCLRTHFYLPTHSSKEQLCRSILNKLRNWGAVQRGYQSNEAVCLQEHVLQLQGCVKARALQAAE